MTLPPEGEGIKFNTVRTGNPDYVRVFVLRTDGCTVGRMTIYKGVYQHTKWYKDHSWREFDESDFVQARVELFMADGRLLTREMYERAKSRAIHLAEDDLRQKLLIRATANAARGCSKGPKITGINPRAIFFREVQ